MEKWPFNNFFSKAQLLRYRQNIPFRKSCRAFSAPPNLEQWNILSYAAGRVCLPGVRIVLAHCDESFFTSAFLGLGRITGATRFAAILADTAQPHALLHAGISGEAFVLEALDCAVSSCWVAETYRKKENPVSPKNSEVVVAVIALGTAAQPITAPIKRKRKLFSKAEKKASTLWPLALTQAEEAIDAAPSAMNKKPWQLTYENNQFTLLSKEALDLGIALLHGESALYSEPRLWLWPNKNQDILSITLLLEEK